MLTVKLTFNYDWPIFRQTPSFSGIWGDYKFIIDPNLKECDFWVVYTEYGLVKEKCICDKENILFIPGEGYNTSNKYPTKFLDQFSKILTVQRQLVGKKVKYGQNGNPWFIEKNYDELLKLKPPTKTKIISVISSNKSFTDGHQKRVEFVKKLKVYFGEKIDVYGRGINDFDKKWDVTAPYKFQIVIENDNTIDWVTEKLFDPILTYTYPIYYGCPNLNDYISEKSFTRINIDNFDESVKIIENLINDDSLYDDFQKNCNSYQKTYLNNHQFFPTIVNTLNEMRSKNYNTKDLVILHGIEKYKNVSFFSRVKQILKKIIRKIFPSILIYLSKMYQKSYGNWQWLVGKFTK